MRTQQADRHSWLLRSALVGLAVLATAAVPIFASAADGDKPAEQTPEEAAGGRMNLMRIKKACEEDIKRLCADIRPGGGRLLQCLRGKPDQLSPACREVMASRAENR